MKKEQTDIKIYPNPVTDYAYVEIGFDFKEGEIMLYDMGGRQLQNLKTKNRVTKINTQTLVQGAYLITIKTNDNKTANAKLIKK
ncbi:T9SS type A sorting domain-containing protein [Chryseobacterium ureilyticum]|nr:T9SS type A sorting domain-containing protein [Chryseobacterium ureilyticum]